jgi:hypothetical protein
MTSGSKPPELTAAREAVRHLEAADPLRALTLLREARLNCPDPAPGNPQDEREIRRLRFCIEQAIDEIEVSYPGHALRRLRIAVGRAPLG